MSSPYGLAPLQSLGASSTTPYQTASGTVTSGSFSSSTASASNPTIMIVYAGNSAATTVPTISDSVSGTYTQLVTAAMAAGSATIFGRIIKSSTSFTVTCSGVTTTAGQMWIEEWAGPQYAVTSPTIVDQTNNSVSAGGVTTLSAAVTTTSPAELVVSLVVQANATTTPWSISGTGWSIPASWAELKMIPGHNVLETPGTTTGAFSWNTSRASVAVTASLLPMQTGNLLEFF